VVVLDFGRQIAEGPPETIKTNPYVIEAYLGKVEAMPDAGS
jgi:branched-chain amino acid transport system permease protein